MRLSRSAKISRYFGLGICAAPLISSYFYAAGYRINFIFCPWRHWFGSICPSCGMTRSFVSIVRGDWKQAIDYHLFGPLLFIYLGTLVIHWSWELSSGNYQQTFHLNWLHSRHIQITIVVVFIGYYLLRLNSIVPNSHL
ncbi:DUF2752 domain-containing protein [Chamaesiphon sp. VAR_48_metabat_403]|uniref:DUF2752 domain-containing protein n=1 Tax=Chamaesiphon sp. VAR_48_metabat_403 TaxID=2964700 RepID=UPI00286E8D24|nr:DUF2752 domain-containing protein [Chamaesiphon sp. VAR_48_metabat_403]